MISTGEVLAMADLLRHAPAVSGLIPNTVSVRVPDAAAIVTVLEALAAERNRADGEVVAAVPIVELLVQPDGRPFGDWKPHYTNRAPLSKDMVDSGWKLRYAYSHPPADQYGAAVSITKAMGEAMADVEEQSYKDADGCPTEMAVLKRFWRNQQLIEDVAPLMRAGGVPDSWVDRSAQCAVEIIKQVIPDVFPMRNHSGKGLPHLRWMTEQLATKQVGSGTKACRWLGYLQGSLVALGLSTLDREKQRNLRSATAPPTASEKGNGL